MSFYLASKVRFQNGAVFKWCDSGFSRKEAPMLFDTKEAALSYALSEKRLSSGNFKRRLAMHVEIVEEP